MLHANSSKPTGSLKV